MVKKLATTSVKKKKIEWNEIVDIVTRSWYTYLGNKFSDCWQLSVWYDTMYLIQRYSTEAQAAKDLIVKMVWKKWIMFISTTWKLVENNTWQKKVVDLFRDPHTNSFKSFRDKYYTNHFCSWSVNCFLSTMWDWSRKVQVLDTRNVIKDFDNFWNLKSVNYAWVQLDLNKFHHQITKYNPDQPMRWMSVYESVVYDAMSDHEASKRNYYFFKNNAMPSIILTMDDDIENPEEVEEAIKRFEDKYKWSEKSHWVLATWWIKEVKTIDFSNKDLELLELKKFAIKKMWVVFWFDPRFLWYRDWENGSHSEYQLMASQSDKSMTSFADILEEFMFDVVSKIYPDFPYNWIQLINDQFLDETAKQELVITKLEKWVITVAQAAKELWYPTETLPEYLNNHFLNIQRDTVENIINKSRASIKQIEKSTEEMGDPSQDSTTESEDSWDPE